MSKKFLYLFKEGHDAFGGDQTTMKNILGGKGAGLAEMTHAGMPVPQGFTITTDACTQYYADNREINDEIKVDIFKYMGILEKMDRSYIEAAEDLGASPWNPGRADWQEVRRYREPAAGFRSFRRTSVHARHDGYHPEPGPERRGC